MYLEAYAIQFKNAEGQLVTIKHFDTTTFTEMEGDTNFTYLQAGGTPLLISVINNEENKFTPIIGKQAEIEFKSHSNANLYHFIWGEESRWLTEIDVDGQTLFVGHLVFDDSSEDYINPVNNNAVRLTATDNLGLLKETPLTDFNGLNPKGKYRIIDLIAMCLAKTGLQLRINVVYNIREESTPTQHFWLSGFEDAKSFEQEIGESEDCYTVLEKILGHSCRLCQYKGEWWIIRVGEYDTQNFRKYYFDYDGGFLNNSDEYHNRVIGAEESVWWSEESTFVAPRRPYGEVKLIYDYDTPKELIDNINFERGQLLTPVVVEAPADNIGSAYTIEDWDAYAGVFPSTTSIGAGSTAYAIRYFKHGMQQDHFIRLTSNVSTYQHLCSHPVALGSEDKVTFAVDVRLGIKGTILGANLKVQLILRGDSGQDYIAVGDPKEAFLGDGPEMKWDEYTGQDDGIVYQKTVNGGEWVTLKTLEDLPPLPENGDLYVILPFVHDDNVDYKNLTVTATPFINGGYAPVKGQFNKMYTTGKYKSKINERVYLSDSPKRIFKGALFKQSGDNYVLCNRFFDGNIKRDGLFTVPISVEKNLILVHHRNNVSGDADYSYVGWFVYLTEAVPEGYYLVNGYEAAYHDSSAYPPDPALPPSVIDLSGLTFKGSTQADVIQNTRFSNHYFTNQSEFLPTVNIVTITGLTAADLQTFGYLQALDVWNQYNRVFRLFDARLQGLGGADWCDVIHKYFITDTTPHTSNKYFLLLHMEQDWNLCSWKAVFAEVMDVVIGKDTGSPHEFKYLYE